MSPPTTGAHGPPSADKAEIHALPLQNTPAQFHGRPDLVRQLTEELRQLL